jgi:hypothetical protein
MRIFVGTLYTIENEFDECVAAVEDQSYRDFQHFVFEGLPNKEAHDTLYGTFMERSDDFDLLVKVDADMVIEDGDLLSKIVDKFEANEWLKDLEIAVYDFFSDQLIWGMHAYRSTVRWRRTDENLFVDSCPVGPEETLHDDSELAPAAIHCKNPSSFQAFRYGVHKALKMVQPGRVSARTTYSRYHWNILHRTRDNFRRRKDPRMGLAVLGAELALQGGISPAHMDYSNPLLRELFERYETNDIELLQQRIEAMSGTSFGFLPSAMRRRALLARARLRAWQTVVSSAVLLEQRHLPKR